MDDVLLSVGLDLSKLQKQLSTVKNTVKQTLGTGALGAQTAQLTKTQNAFAQSLQKPLAGLKKVSNEENKLAKIRASANQRLRSIRLEENQLGQTRSGLTRRLRVHNDLLAKGATTTNRHAQATRGLKTRLSNLGKASGGVLKKITGIVKKTAIWAIGWTAMYSVIRGLTSLLKEAGTAFITLESAMARIETVTTTTGQSIDDTMKGLRQTILTTVGEMPTTIEAASEALFKLSTAHLNAEQAAAALNPVMKLVVATTKDLNNQTQLASQTATSVAAIYNNYADQITGVSTESEKFLKISALLFNTFRQQQIELDELTQGLKFTIGVFSQAKVPFEQLVAVLGVLNTQAIKSGQAGRGLQRTLIQIISKADEMAKAYGIAFDPAKPIDFLETVRQIKTAVEAQAGAAGSLAEAYKIFGLRAGPTLLAFYRDTLIKCLESLLNKRESKVARKHGNIPL